MGYEDEDSIKGYKVWEAIDLDSKEEEKKQHGHCVAISIDT